LVFDSGPHIGIGLHCNFTVAPPDVASAAMLSNRYAK
jgi:hypothetical protein